MKKFCEVCCKEVDTKIIRKKETYKVLGEPIEVEAQVCVCANCGEEIFSEDLDNQTLLSAYNEYRSRHKLLLPEEIKSIREQYGLSQRSFAKLLNWGDKTVHRYENGAIQDKTHNSLLLFLRKPENMITYLHENEILLDDKQMAKLSNTLDQLLIDSKYTSERRLFNIFFSSSPTIENGFKSFDYEKLCAMVLFFANRSQLLLKTKLLKLINYSDFLFYKENGISISGNKYKHLPYGPVMENHDFLFGAMETDHIVHIEIELDNGYEKHQVIPEMEMPDGVLSKDELQVLERVYDKFKDFGSVDISNYSHQEKGYMETSLGEVIPYTYACDINLDR